MIEIGEAIALAYYELCGHYGINDFIICRVQRILIKEYFHNYFLHSSDVTIDIRKIL